MNEDCTVYRIRHVRQILNMNFANCWIGRNGVIRWPSRASNLAPILILFVGKIKTNRL